MGKPAGRRLTWSTQPCAAPRAMLHASLTAALSRKSVMGDCTPQFAHTRYAIARSLSLSLSVAAPTPFPGHWPFCLVLADAAAKLGRKISRLVHPKRLYAKNFLALFPQQRLLTACVCVCPRVCVRVGLNKQLARAHTRTYAHTRTRYTADLMTAFPTSSLHHNAAFPRGGGCKMWMPLEPVRVSAAWPSLAGWNGSPSRTCWAPAPAPASAPAEHSKPVLA